METLVNVIIDGPHDNNIMLLDYIDESEYTGVLSGIMNRYNLFGYTKMLTTLISYGADEYLVYLSLLKEGRYSQFVLLYKIINMRPSTKSQLLDDIDKGILVSEDISAILNDN